MNNGHNRSYCRSAQTARKTAKAVKRLQGAKVVTQGLIMWSVANESEILIAVCYTALHLMGHNGTYWIVPEWAYVQRVRLG